MAKQKNRKEKKTKVPTILDESKKALRKLRLKMNLSTRIHSEPRGKKVYDRKENKRIERDF